MSLRVRVVRDAPNANWGLRIRGGRDVDQGTPIVVTKVELGGACEGLLEVGDVIVSIDGVQLGVLRHSDVQQLLRHAGTTINIVLNRQGVNKGESLSSSATSTVPSSLPFKSLPANSSRLSSLNTTNMSYCYDPRAAQAQHQPPHFESYHPPQGAPVQQVPAPKKRTLEMDGIRKQVVSQQFNSPMSLYSDETLTDVAISNINAGIPVDGSNVVPASRPQLPVPSDGSHSKAPDSATFKMVLESEMAEAKRKEALYGSNFAGPKGYNRPAQAPQPADPVMLDQSINQSSSFKRLMNSMVHNQEPQN